MNWMLMPLKRYAEFSGRSRRMEYWMFQLFLVLVYIAVLVLWAMSRTTGLPTGGELGMREPFGLLDGLAERFWVAERI